MSRLGGTAEKQRDDVQISVFSFFVPYRCVEITKNRLKTRSI